MKFIITNPDALINKETGKPYSGIVEVLKAFNSVKGQQVIVISLENAKLTPIPKEFIRWPVNKRERLGVDLISRIQKVTKADISELFVLGCKKADVALAANSRLLLLRADYAKAENADESIYEKGYGIGIKSHEKLKLFFDQFLDIQQPWFFKLAVTDATTILSLTNANTIYRSSDIVKLSDSFKACLKDGIGNYREEFMTYFLVSIYAIINDLGIVDYLSIYPSSKTTENEDLEYFKEKMRTSFKSYAREPILIRHQPAETRHRLPIVQRIRNGCDGELATIRLNPHYRGLLKGKTVCIIDDFTNIGSSCETARLLLEAEEVKKLIFITMGKFGGDTYYQYTYGVKGDLFGKFVFKQTGRPLRKGSLNTKSDIAFIQSLGGIIK